ncbi:MAG: tetratricopeptide repeat protein [Gemmatimonadetes bacterium]|nr:tetratricopeptide repeat protein [Gemmatimonadota bacterium]
MIRRSKISAAVAAAILSLALPSGVNAQQPQGRFRVVIPNLQPTNGADKKFGEKTAEDLRGLMNELLTHQPVAKKELDKALKQFKLKMDDLDCPKTRQLAAQINAEVALCATYAPEGSDYVVNAQFWDTRSNESFEIKPVTVPEKDYQAAAKGIFDQFDRYTTQLRAAANCQSYATSRQWDTALEQCNKALELNPNAQSTRYLKAHIYYDMKRYPESLAELDTLLKENPIHEEGLNLAGYVAGTMGEEQKAVDYYTRYLELQPGNAQVRMKIAYDLAQAGDPGGAMQLIQAGLDVDPDNVDLLEQYGGFAFAAGKKIADKARADSADAGGLPPEAAEDYHQAIDAYLKVYKAKGADTNPSQLRTLIAAYIELDEVDQAISTAEEALKTHPDDDGIWSYYADALQRSGKLDEALAALDRVKEINPDYPNVAFRQGKWLIQAGRLNDAVNALKSAAADPKQAETAARLIFNDAYANGVQKKNYTYAADGLGAALTLPNLTPRMIAQLTFWQGYSIYQSAYVDQAPNTVATAKSTLPRFQKALGLLQKPGVGDYAKSVNVNITEMIDNVKTFIDIQEKIIKRGD